RADALGSLPDVAARAAVDVVVSVHLAGVRTKSDGLFRGRRGSATGADFAERLSRAAATLAISDSRAAAAHRIEQRSESPSPENVSKDAFLSTENIRRIVHREVVDELVVEVLRAIAVVEIVKIQRSAGAIVLRQLRSAQCASVSKVRDGS